MSTPPLPAGHRDRLCRPLTITALALILVALAGACSGDDDPEPSPTASATQDADTDTGDGLATEPDDDLTGRWTWEDAQCEFAEPESVATSCGWLEVPERWDGDDDTDTIRLHVGLFSAGPNDNPPVVYLEGGPGGDPLSNVALSFRQLFGTLVEDRDLVVLSQRGTGLSEPVLQCTEVLDLDIDLLDEDLDPVDEVERAVVAHDQCANRLERAGADFAAYNSVQSANDVEALRRALGHDRWDVLGISYGTRLAQTLIREHPNGIRAVVLDSVVPIDRAPQSDIPVTAQRAFETLFDSCAASPTCNDAYPDFEERWFAMVEQLDGEPVTFVTANPITAERHDVLVDGEDLMSIGFQSLYSGAAFSSLPHLIELLEAGDTSGLSTLVGVQLANSAFAAVGTFWTVECHEEIAFMTDTDVEDGRTGDARYDLLVGGDPGVELQEAVCQSFDGGAAADIENVPVQSDLPVLVLAGSYDPVTPPEDGRSLLDTFTNGSFVELPHTGHAALTQECGQRIASTFLDDPGGEPDISCVDEVPEPAWVPALFDDLDFEPFSYDADFFGASGVVPDGWEAGFDGTFSRTENLLRSSVIVQQSIEGVPTSLILDSIAAIGDDAPALVEERQVGRRIWEHYEMTFPGAVIDAFIAEDDDVTYLVLLQHAPDDHDAAVAALVDPILEAIEP